MGGRAMPILETIDYYYEKIRPCVGFLLLNMIEVPVLVGAKMKKPIKPTGYSMAIHSTTQKVDGHLDGLSLEVLYEQFQTVTVEDNTGNQYPMNVLDGIMLNKGIEELYVCLIVKENDRIIAENCRKKFTKSLVMDYDICFCSGGDLLANNKYGNDVLHYSTLIV
jgi:hypothetical protein